MNREARLKGYHARKVAERRQRDDANKSESSVPHQLGLAVTQRSLSGQINNKEGNRNGLAAAATSESRFFRDAIYHEQCELGLVLPDEKVKMSTKNSSKQPIAATTPKQGGGSKSPIRSEVRALPSGIDFRHRSKNNVIEHVNNSLRGKDKANKGPVEQFVNEPSSSTLNEISTKPTDAAAKNPSEMTTKLAVRSETKPIDKSEMKRIFAARRRKAQIEMTAKITDANGSSDGGEATSKAVASDFEQEKDSVGAKGMEEGAIEFVSDGIDALTATRGGEKLSRGDGTSTEVEEKNSSTASSVLNNGSYQGKAANIHSMRGVNDFRTATPESRSKSQDRSGRDAAAVKKQACGEKGTATADENVAIRTVKRDSNESSKTSKSTASSNSRRALEMYMKQRVSGGSTGNQSLKNKGSEEKSEVTNSQGSEQSPGSDQKSSTRTKEKQVLSPMKEKEVEDIQSENTSATDTIGQNESREKTVRFLSPLERRNPQCSPPRMRLPEVEVQNSVLTEESQEEEDVDFLLFVAGLKREVAGDHTELWSGFQSLMGMPKDQHSLLYSTPADEVQPSDKKKKRRVRMDPQTQSSLTMIHKALANDDRIKGGFMKTASQLVNDKQVKKDRELQKRLEIEKMESEQRQPATLLAESVNGADDAQSVASRSCQRIETPKYESSLNESACSEKDKKPTWINSYKKKKSLYLSAYASSNPNKDKSPTISPASSNSSSLKPASNSSFKSSTSSISSLQSRRKSVANGGTVKSKVPSWLEALKKKQKSLRSKGTTPPDQVKIEDSEPIVFQLSPRKRPKYTPPPSPDTAAVPWANVKLRSTPKRGDLSLETVAQNVSRVEKSESAGKAESDQDSLPNLFSAGEIIDMDSLPPSEIFPLLTSKWTDKQETKRIVIVGKDLVATANRIVGEDRKASVLWWSHRCEIRSLTLSVDAAGATLALTDGRPSMPLAFPSADVCLNFAQYFLRGPSKPDEERDLDVELSPSTDADTSVLTAEEESLLDKYRQYSQSERLKLKLTCLSPRGEPEELEVNLSPRIADQVKIVDASVPEKYSKMLELGIPASAVRHKMKIDGIDGSIVALVVDANSDTTPKCENQSVLSGREVPAADEGVNNKMMSETTPSLTDEQSAIATKYRKMLKMGVPPDAVRHKMTSEGVDSKIIDTVFEPLPVDPITESAQLTGDEEVVASKYRKMLKMRVPLDAVRHKMTQENVDTKIVSAIVSEAGGEPDVLPTPIVTKAVESSAPLLTEEEEREASKYRKMIKVCIPKDAIRHEMKKQGVSDKIVEVVLGKEWVEAKDVIQSAIKQKESNRKTIQFHWTTSKLPPELLQQSIFGKVEQKKRKIETINPEEADIKKLHELFQKKDNSAAAKKKAAAAEGAADGMAKLLDLTRANNIAISLKAFNDFTFRDLAETINDLDPDQKIVGERVQFIPNLLPNPKEIAAIKKFKGDDDKLITAELFFKQLVSIKRIEDKVQVMKSMHFFEDHVAEVREGFKTLQEVCNQVLNSEKLLQVLQMVLNIGNLMNEGTLNGGVDAFKFESLSKLSQTKSADGKTTVLDYIVETFISKGERDVLNLLTEFPDVQESSRLSIGDLIGELNSLRKDYNLCKIELTRMKNDQSSKRVTRSMTNKVDEESEVEDPRKALFAAIKSRVPKEETPPPDPRQALFAAIKSRKENAPGDSIDTSGSNKDYTPGVQRLQDFLNHSKTVLSLANADQDAAVRACKGLAVYCGEEGGERAAAPLLQIICEFASSLDSGVKKYDARKEADAKKAAKLAKDKGNKDKENRVKTMHTPKKLLKASALQPHVGVIDNMKTRSPLRPDTSIDARQAIFNAIKNNEVKPKRSTIKPNKETSTSKQALFKDIKSGKKPSEVKESRILLVNKMLQEAPANVKRDFLRGVTYDNTDDPILRKIYEKESYSPKSN